MTVAELLNDASRRGVSIWAEGSRLLYRPKDALTPELEAALKANKAEVLAVLEARVAIRAVNQVNSCGPLHVQPAKWVHRDGKAYCPACERFLGYVKGER